MKALIFSRDPGGANQMIGLYEALTGASDHPGVRTILDRLGPQPEFLVYAKDFAVPLWKGDGHPYSPLPSGLDDTGMDTLLGDLGVGAVLTATSDIDDGTHRALWRSARRLGIPSHGFVDGDFNVLLRFRGSDGEAWPDHVYTPGSASADPILATGYRDVTIVPDFPLIVQKRRAENAHARSQALRASWGAEPNRKVVLFASENVIELVAMGKYSPYSEIESLERLLAGLSGREQVPGLAPDADALVVIRPHPKENGNKFAKHLREGAVIVSAAGSAVEAIMAADMVVGMNSTLLRESLMLGKPTLSLVDARIHQVDRP